jgi:hypothetical protein
MRFHLAPAIPAALFTALLLACTQTSEPGDTGTVAGGCVTDYSCPFGEECGGAGCVPIATSLYPHIQTASALVRAPIDDAEQTWRAAHYDLCISRLDPDRMRATNPGIRMFEYTIARYQRFGTGPNNPDAWAVAHGYDPEDFYLHYREDVNVPTWEGVVLVPGFPPGVVPGWNPGGGGNPASATERSQSRVVGFRNGMATPWYFANLTHPGFRRFLVEHARMLVQGTWYDEPPFASGMVDGVMIDLGIYLPLFGEGQLDRTSEFYGVPVNEDHPYAVANETLYPFLAGELKRALGATVDLMPNYGHVYFLDYPSRSTQDILSTTPWILGEVWVTYTGTWTPTSGGDRCITYEKDYDNAVTEIVRQTRAGGRRVIGARDTASGSVGTDRGKLLTLGLYYLVNNRHTYYMYDTQGGHQNPAPISTWSWNPAVEFDVGQPDVIPVGKTDFEGRPNTKEHYEFATGADPYNPSLTYHVFARRYTNALVLVKLLPEGSVTDDRSITTHALDGTYAPLLADGSLGAAVNVAVIRNNEALILIRLD